MADNENSSGDEVEISFFFVIFLSLLALVLVLSKFLHDRPKLASVLPEAGMTVIVGIIAGGIVYLVNPTSSSDDNNNNNVGDDNDDDGNNNAHYVADGLLSFSPTVFFVALLPPIIFNSGYHLRKELFFRHIIPISLFSCLGTLISALIIATLLHLAVTHNLTGTNTHGSTFQPTFAELLTFGALISATDPVSTLAVFQQKRVDPHLFYLVFGESVLNDAVGLVLFNAFSKFVGQDQSAERVVVAIITFLMDFLYLFTGSLLLGGGAGLLFGFFLKNVDMRHTPLLELSLYVLVMYLPFFFAEVLELSGIVTILFTGISARRYAMPNLSGRSEADAEALFRVTAHMAEMAIFLELGMSVFGLASYGNFYGGFIGWALLGCLVSRACNVYPITFLFNRSLRRTEEKGGGGSSSRKEPTPGLAQDLSRDLSHCSYETRTPARKKDLKISWNTATMLWFSGLRGAVAYACAKSFPDDNGHRTVFVITTMVIVLVTVFILGGTTELVLGLLDIEMNVNEEEYMEDQERYIKSMLQGKNVGQLMEFEENTLIPCVVRADTEQEEKLQLPPPPPPELNDFPSPMSLMNSVRSIRSERSERALMALNIEMTETSHMNLMRSLGYHETSVSGSNRRSSRRRSVFDYGASC